MRIKLLALILAIIMVLLLLPACQSNVTTATTATTTKAATATTATTATTASMTELSFNVFQAHYGFSMLGKPVYEEWLKRCEEYMGMKLMITWDEMALAEYREKFKVYLAAGKYADVFFSDGNLVDILNLGDNGLLANVKTYIDDMPNYKLILDQGNNRKKVETVNGDMFFLSRALYNVQTGSQWTFAARRDLLETHGLTPPTTLNELYETSKMLKAVYPDSYPFGIQHAGWAFDTTLWKMNKVDVSIYYDGQKYIYGPLDESDKFKQMVEFLAKMYQEGLIDPETWSQTSDQYIRKCLDGTYMFQTLCWAAWYFDGTMNNSEYPEATWVQIPRPKDLNGEPGWKPDSGIEGYTLDGSQLTCVSVKADNIDMIMKLLDYQYTEEMRVLMNWGLEGVTYETNADGKRMWMSEVLNASNPRAALEQWGPYASVSIRPGFSGSSQVDLEAELSLMPAINVWADGNYLEMNPYLFSDKYEGEESIFPGERAPYIVLPQDQRDEETTIMGPLKTFVTEEVTKFITNEKPMNEWDTFIEVAKNMGDYKKVVDYYNEAANG